MKGMGRVVVLVLTAAMAMPAAAATTRTTGARDSSTVHKAAPRTPVHGSTVKKATTHPGYPRDVAGERVWPLDLVNEPVKSDLAPDVPHHEVADFLAFGGHAQIRAADDRIMGVSNPDWISVPRVNAFLLARANPKVRFEGEATYDRATDDLVLERGLIDVRLGTSWAAHGGVIQPPLGRVNFDHDAPQSEFENLSYVATDLIGVPNPQLGIGAHGVRGSRNGPLWNWELDAVSGYDEGVITQGSLGTRLPMGRNTLGTGSGSWALAGRVAFEPGARSEIGIAMLGGSYAPLQMDGVTVDPSHMLALSVIDAHGTWRGFRLATEAGAAWIDVPGGLEGLYAERQMAASVEASRTLRAPLFGSWPSTAVVGALRADAIDDDAEIPGDSRERITFSLNFRHVPWSVLRGGWYHEWRRDRFNNVKPAGGMVFSFATYF